MTAQALIFDLDDTLIDTYGQLVPEAHRQACIAMVNAGLPVPVDELYATRQALLMAHPRTEINTLLAEHYGYPDPAIIQAGHDTYLNPQITELEPFPGVPELLTTLADAYRLFLVTAGFTHAQQKKIEVLGIGHHFHDICFVDPTRPGPQTKHEAFQILLDRHGISPHHTVVIGDRITNEIAAGNRLGCHTIWMRHGECAHITPEHPDEHPHHTIDAIHQLTGVLPPFYAHKVHP
jgi:HAD superfamily hydrolase (TIGR01509 family)